MGAPEGDAQESAAVKYTKIVFDQGAREKESPGHFPLMGKYFLIFGARREPPVEPLRKQP
jgi:hypothetical protein